MNMEKEKTMIVIIKKKGSTTTTEILGDKSLMSSLIYFVYQKIYEYLPR